jgi:hypothetical protein
MKKEIDAALQAGIGELRKDEAMVSLPKDTYRVVHEHAVLGSCMDLSAFGKKQTVNMELGNGRSLVIAMPDWLTEQEASGIRPLFEAMLAKAIDGLKEKQEFENKTAHLRV